MAIRLRVNMHVRHERNAVTPLCKSETDMTASSQVDCKTISQTALKSSGGPWTTTRLADKAERAEMLDTAYVQISSFH